VAGGGLWAAGCTWGGPQDPIVIEAHPVMAIWDGYIS
jgi:hypothetical protein